MKKWALAVAMTAGLIGLTACSNGNSEKIVETKAGDITKDEFYSAMKDRYGKAVIQEMVYEKFYLKIIKSPIKKSMQNLTKSKLKWVIISKWLYNLLATKQKMISSVL